MKILSSPSARSDGSARFGNTWFRRKACGEGGGGRVEVLKVQLSPWCLENTCVTEDGVPVHEARGVGGAALALRPMNPSPAPPARMSDRARLNNSCI